MLSCVCIIFLFSLSVFSYYSYVFFFNDPATTEIYTLSLHDALPILDLQEVGFGSPRSSSRGIADGIGRAIPSAIPDRKSTRLNSSHTVISYAVFCLKKKKTNRTKKETNRQIMNTDQQTLYKSSAIVT